MNAKARFKRAFEYGGKPSDAEIARRVSKLLEGSDRRESGVPTQTIQKIRNQGLSTSGYVPHIAYCLGVSGIWLAEGVGEMIPADWRYRSNNTSFEDFFRLPRNVQEHFSALFSLWNEQPNLRMVADSDEK